jgi:hypothetical protein
MQDPHQRRLEPAMMTAAPDTLPHPLSESLTASAMWNLASNDMEDEDLDDDDDDDLDDLDEFDDEDDEFDDLEDDEFDDDETDDETDDK